MKATQQLSHQVPVDWSEKTFKKPCKVTVVVMFDYLVLWRDKDLPEGGEELQSSQQQFGFDALLRQQIVQTRQSLRNTTTMNKKK